MKKKKTKLLLLLLSIALLCSACAMPSMIAPQNEAQASDAKDEQIARLETELTQMREKETQYLSRIDTLEARVAQLSAAKDTDPLAERVTFYYREDNGGAMITGYSGNAAILTLPAYLDGLPVTAIGERAFAHASFVALTLPDGIVSIDWFAFYECLSLTDITIPASVTSIGYAVFDGCPALVLHCPVNSYAAQYAQSYAIPYTSY